MRIITTTNLLSKYNLSHDDATALLKPLSDNIDILDRTDYAGVKAHCDTVDDSILLFGGHDIVPFAILPNPCSDPDPQLYSDAPYACTKDMLFFTPDKVVARLPDEHMQGKFDFVQTVVQRQASHLDAEPSTAGWFNYVASVWKPVSDYMNAQFSMHNQNISPPIIEGTIPNDSIRGKRYTYVNLHGSASTSAFYGQGGGGYPTAMLPVEGRFNDSILFTEACYGGLILNRNRQTSIPLMALFSGALGVVASSTIVYGPASPPLDGADAFSYCFYKRILAGESLGNAFMHAKGDFITMVIHNSGNLEPSNKKLLLQFALYATPDIRA